ncbi:MAG: hypothetical protein ACFFBP_18230 [Promethearchaeota archaeon]
MPDQKEQVKRTTVTLSDITMNQVNELIGVFGNNSAAVISKIVEHFFYYGRFDDLLKNLRAKKRELYPPEQDYLNKKIATLLKGVDEIPFEEFIEDLELDRKFAVNNFHIWSEKFKIRRKGNLIVKVQL